MRLKHPRPYLRHLGMLRELVQQGADIRTGCARGKQTHECQDWDELVCHDEIPFCAGAG